MPTMTRQVHLVQRPDGMPSPRHFMVVDAELPGLEPGQVLVENLWMSVDPYMRRNMDADAKDLEPWPLNAPLDGPAVGRVVKSLNPAFAPGDIVESLSGWQDHFISDGAAFVPFLSASNALIKRTANGIDPRDYVGLLGVAPMTAYAAMSCLSNASPGDTVVISGGAGTVGSVACQIGKIKGLRVVSSAGSDDKVRWLIDDLGVDHAFNYRRTSYETALAEACPGGIDLVLENTSPDHLSACLPLMNEMKQILISGFISVYNTGGKVPPFKNFEYVLDRFLTIKAYRFMDSLHAYDAFVADMVRWRDQGWMQFRETHFHGLEQAPAAFCRLFEQNNAGGKILVRLGEAHI